MKAPSVSLSERNQTLAQVYPIVNMYHDLPMELPSIGSPRCELNNFAIKTSFLVGVIGFPKEHILFHHISSLHPLRPPWIGTLLVENLPYGAQFVLNKFEETTQIVNERTKVRPKAANEQYLKDKNSTKT